MVWPGASHALIGSNWTHRCNFHATTDPAKFHPDRSTFGRMAPKKTVFSL